MHNTVPLRRHRGVRPCVRLLLAAAALLGLAARAAAAPWPTFPPPTGGVVVDGTDRTTSARPKPRPAANRLILKLRAETGAPCLGCRLASRQPLGALGVGSGLDGLFAAHGVRAARPLVRHAPLASVDARSRFPERARRAPAGETAPLFDRTWVLTVRAMPDLRPLASALAADPAVEYCEPDLVLEAASVPNDPFFASAGSWGQPFDDLWGVKRVGAPAAWDVTRGAGVVVAVVDTGIDAGHPDLAANVWTNPGEIPDNGIDDDGNGFVDDVRGWNFADDDADTHDDFSHGTHVAGTIAAVGDNGSGVVGVAYESTVMPVRGIGTYGFGYASDLAEAILYAVDNGADVINASWGGGFSQTIADAVSAAHAAGVVFVAAAGNANADAGAFFPAGNPDAVTVAAFTHADARASFSNYGAKLDLAAPGGGDDPPPKTFAAASILSTLASGLAYVNTPDPALVLTSGGASYVRYAGTSMAAPHVSGVAALVIASHPGIGVEQVRQLLRTTAFDVAPPGRDDQSGYGIVNAAAAVTAPMPLAAHIASPAGTTLVGPLTVSIVGTAAGPGFTSYGIDYRPAADPNGWVTIAGPVATPVDGGELAAWDASVLTDGDYVLRLRVERPGETFGDETVVHVKNAVLTAPEPLAALRPDGPIAIRGTAAGPGFVGYTVEVSRPALDGYTWHGGGITLAVPPGTPVHDGVLATLDASSLTAGDRFDFRLVVTNASGATEVVRRGIVIDPTIRPGWPQDVVPGGDREYLTLADLDGDGAEEVLVGSGGEVVAFGADGSPKPGWPEPVTLGDPNAFTHGSPLVADITGDAAPEVIAMTDQRVFAWSADGTLLPNFPIVSDVFVRSANEWLSAGDLDGDGKAEIVCTGNRGIQAFHGDGTEVPGLSTTSPVHGPAAVGDVFGDFSSELAFYVARRDNVLFGKGTVNLVAGDGRFLGGRSVKGTTYTRTWLADLDGDGRLDMVVLGRKPNSAQPISVTAVDATGRALALRKPKITGVRQTPSRQLAFSDLDRDGRAEAWAYVPTAPPGPLDDRFDHFAPYLAKTNPAVQPVLEHRLFQVPLDRDGPFGIAIGDIDGDGVQELVGGAVLNGCGTLGDTCPAPIRRALAVQHADGTLVPGFPKPVPQLLYEDSDLAVGISFFMDDMYAATPAIGDLDGDGLKEIVWYDPEASRIFVWNVPGTPGPLLADWPMYAHDARHSNTLPPTLP